MANSLHNLDNYKKVFTYSTSEICAKYFGLVTEYLIQCVETIFMRNKKYYKFIICKGINTITHVFKLLLLYTRNLDLTYHHCQKSFYYYVEFIGQIGDDNHSFLQLNSKDAALFVYKKTIFELNNEFRKDFVSEINTNTIMENVDTIMDIHNSCFCDIIMELDIDLEDKFKIIQKVNDKICKLTQNILNLVLLGDEKQYTNNLQLVKVF